MAGENAVPRLSQAMAVASSYLDAAIRVLLLGLIAVLPFKALLVVERNGFLLLLLLLVLWCLYNGQLFYRKTPYDVMLLSFVLWVGFTIPFAAFPSYSLKEYGKLLQWMVVLYAVVHFLGDVRYRQGLLSVVGCSLLIVSVNGLTQFNLTNPQAIVSFFPSEVWLTTYLVMTIPFCLAAAFGENPPRVKRTGAVLSILSVACLLSTQSRAGLVAFMTELVAMAWLVRTTFAKWVAGLVALSLVAVVIIAVTIKSPSVSGENPQAQSSIPVRTGVATIVHRLDIWRFTLSEIAEHWIVGIGYGGQTYSLLYGKESETVEPGHLSVKDKGTHNIFLYLALHVGIAGMVLFMWFLFRTIRTTLQEYREARDWMSKMVLAGAAGSLVGLFVRLQFDQMLVGSLAILFWVLLAMAVAHYPSLQSRTNETVES